MVLGCTFRGWFSAFPQLSMPVVSTGEQRQDMLTMSAVVHSTEIAWCSWKPALCYTTAVQRLQRQRLCQQTPHFKAVATIAGSNREERSWLWVPEANLSLRRKNRIQKNLTEKQWVKNPCSFIWDKSCVLKKLSKLLPHPINIFFSTYGMSLSQLPPPDIPISDYA